jgi:hypothetical protein
MAPSGAPCAGPVAMVESGDTWQDLAGGAAGLAPLGSEGASRCKCVQQPLHPWGPYGVVPWTRACQQQQQQDSLSRGFVFGALPYACHITGPARPCVVCVTYRGGLGCGIPVPSLWLPHAACTCSLTPAAVFSWRTASLDATNHMQHVLLYHVPFTGAVSAAE